VRLFSTPTEFGIIGVGQEAHGVFAFGQVARGFVAVGQLAVDVVAVGQLSFSILGVGQVGGGISWFAGMLGVGGRGLCLRLIPGLDPQRVAPETIDLARVRSGESGFVKLKIEAFAQERIKLAPAVFKALEGARGQVPEVYASLRRVGEHVVCDRVMEVPGRKPSSSTALTVVRVGALIALATTWCAVFASAVLGVKF
jgi:hypothetical protein